MSAGSAAACPMPHHGPSSAARRCAGAGVPCPHRRQDQAAAGSWEARKQFIFQWKLTGTGDTIPGQGVTGGAERRGADASGHGEQDGDPGRIPSAAG